MDNWRDQLLNNIVTAQSIDLVISLGNLLSDMICARFPLKCVEVIMDIAWFGKSFMSSIVISCNSGICNKDLILEEYLQITFRFFLTNMACLCRKLSLISSVDVFCVLFVLVSLASNPEFFSSSFIGMQYKDKKRSIFYCYWEVLCSQSVSLMWIRPNSSWGLLLRLLVWWVLAKWL